MKINHKRQNPAAETAGKTRPRSAAELAHLASFPEFNPDPVIELDAKGRVRYLNPAALQRFPDLKERGSEHPFLAGWDALAPEIIAKKLPLLTRELKAGRCWYEQAVTYVPSLKRFRIFTRDITRHHQAETALHKNRRELEKRVRERTLEISNACEDLKKESADRLRAEEAVKAERQQFNDVLETLPCYLVLLSPDYHVPYANRFFRERFGESRGRRCFEYLFNRTEPCEVCETFKVLQKMQPLEWEWVGPDGHNYHIYDFPFRAADGATLIMEVGIDITVQKQALAALRQAHDELEARVQERTRELKEVNRLLRLKGAEHQQAETREKRVAEEWRTTFDSITDMVSIQDRDCRLIMVNKAYAAALGMKPEDLNGKNCFAMLHHTDHAIENCPHQETVRTKNTVTREIYEPRLGICLEVTTSPVFGESGEVAGSVHIAKDITGRKKAEKALRENQQDLNRAQAVAHTGSWRLDVRRDELAWSDETYRLFGIPAGTLMTYETFLSAVHPEDRAYVDRKWQAALRGEPYDIEHRIIAGGDIKWVREKAELDFDDHQQLSGGFGTVQDITELKRAEEELRTSENRYRSYIEVTGELGWTTDADGEVVEDIPSFRRFTGQSYEEVKGRGWMKALHPDDLGNTTQMWQKAVEEKNSYETEYRLRRHDGAYRYFLARGVPVFREDGSLREWVGTCIDITDRKRADQMKDEFIGLVSHELRTPLTVITGSLRTVLSEGLSAAEVRELILNASDGADQLATILENMLELSRCQAGRLKLRAEPVSITATARNVIKKLRDQRVSQQFTVDIPADLPPVEADPVRAERILYNLVENAAKYSPEGSQITVSARIEKDLVITAVADQGPGISPENKDRIFEQFQQLQDGARRVTGAGLGLVVCKRLVEAQGGWITLDSEPGKGSVFSFALPKSPSPF